MRHHATAARASLAVRTPRARLLLAMPMTLKQPLPMRLAFPLLGRTWSGHADPTHINLYTPRRIFREMEAAGLRPRVRTGMKPLLWLPPYRRGWSVPYPPWVGNGIVASGTR